MNCAAALDCSCNASFAVKRDTDMLIRERLCARGRNSDRELVPWLLKALDSVGLSLSDIGKWTVGTGPGSYSGIRSGLALVRGICRATGAHCRGVPSSRALALQRCEGVAAGGRIAVLHDGRRRQVIVSAYRVRGHGVRVELPPAVMTPETALARAETWQRIITPHSNELDWLLEQLPDRGRVFACDHVDASELLGVGGAWPAESTATDASLEPIYVRPAVFVPPAPPAEATRSS